MTKILAFSPYALWRHHANYELAILTACRERGAQVRVLLCDGQFSECDLHCGAYSEAPRPFGMCKSCQSDARAIFGGGGLPYEWLSPYLTSENRREAFEWAAGVRPAEFASASFRGHPIGPWVTPSVVNYWRRYPLPLDDWNTVNVYRGFLHAGAVAYLGLSAALDHVSPDALLLFNAQRSVLRVAFKLARARGIRVLVHEATRETPGRLFALTNAGCNSNQPFREFWSNWGPVPLSRGQLTDVHRFLLNRRHGITALDAKFTVAGNGKDPLRKRLGVRDRDRLLALFNSSTDEFDGDSDCPMPYPTQEAWVERVVAWASQRSDCVLAIRAHPCLAGVGWGTRAPALVEWYRSLGERLPANVRLFQPDDPQSSYDLMDAADAAITYGSTAGIEFMALGKPVAVVPAFSIYEDCPGVVRLGNPAELESALDHLMSLGPNREYRRAAYRCLYRRYFHMPLPFKAVTMTATFESQLNYKEPRDLRAGVDDGLDRICEFLLDNKPLFASPTPTDLAQTTAEENSFYDLMESDPDAMKKPPSEQTHPRLLAWGRALRSLPRRAVRKIGYILLRIAGA
jgi:hypothetical protein